MKILAYDSSSDHLSVALYEDEKKLGELSSDAGARHSNVLAPMIEKLLKKTHTKLSEVNVIAVGLGPGSFTGLRIGIVTAKVLGYALKKKIVGVCSLEAVAREALNRPPENQAGREKNARVAVALDARKSKVYGAVYERRGEKYRVIIKPALFDAKQFSGISARPKASHIAGAALLLAQQKKFINPFHLQPLYLHPKDCNATPPKK